ncbi:MAG: DUF2179 domain-containing protein [Chloroflexi bacterium]|nr:DUF2179 domain-containing protein [Chloroflexota bacterium]
MFDWYVWVGLPLIVFFARIADVTLGTMRIIFIHRGRRYLAPLLGFVEVFIWVSVISEITKGAHNVASYLAYAAGFAAGNFIGMLIEDKLAIGTLVVRVIIPAKAGVSLIENLIAGGYGVTSVNAQGSHESVKLIYTVVTRRELPNVAGIINTSYPTAFFTVEEVRSVERGIFRPPQRMRPLNGIFGRKAK